MPADCRPPSDPERFDLLELVPTTARRLLDVACGSGWLGSAVKVRQNARVIGVAASEVAARRASQELDQVITGDIESIQLPFDAGSFDAIVFSEGLDRAREPHT